MSSQFNVQHNPLRIQKQIVRRQEVFQQAKESYVFLGRYVYTNGNCFKKSRVDCVYLAECCGQA